MIPFLVVLFVKLTYSCFPTAPGNPIPFGCCPDLSTFVLPASPGFDSGTFGFTYDNDVCRSTASITCSRGQLTQTFNATIRIDNEFFLDTGLNTVTFADVACNGATGQWVVFNTAGIVAVIDNLECLLSPLP